MYLLTIHVTRKDINRAKTDGVCPVSDAGDRTLKRSDLMFIGSSSYIVIESSIGKDLFRLKPLTNTALKSYGDYLSDIDDDLPVKPTKFVFKVANKYAKYFKTRYLTAPINAGSTRRTKNTKAKSKPKMPEGHWFIEDPLEV